MAGTTTETVVRRGMREVGPKVDLEEMLDAPEASDSDLKASVPVLKAKDTKQAMHSGDELSIIESLHGPSGKLYSLVSKPMPQGKASVVCEAVGQKMAGYKAVEEVTMIDILCGGVEVDDVVYGCWMPGTASQGRCLYVDGLGAQRAPCTQNHLFVCVSG